MVLLCRSRPAMYLPERGKFAHNPATLFLLSTFDTIVLPCPFSHIIHTASNAQRIGMVRSKGWSLLVGERVDGFVFPSYDKG